MTEINELGTGINIAFQFDKAFVIELALHNMFCVMNTESASYFITCKGNNKHTAQYQDIVQATECFENILEIKGCKMNDGEASSVFYVYTKTRMKSVTTDYIKAFLKEKATKVDDSIIDDVALKWGKARSFGPNILFNKTYELHKMEKHYCKAASNAWDILYPNSYVQRN